MNKKIQTIDWETVAYNEAWKRQEELFNATLDKKTNNLPTDNFLIFCEHPHVYTLGKSGKEQNMLIDLIQLQAKNASFVHTNRGGDITYHGPGQIVGYPIFDLDNFNFGLKQYIDAIEQCIINVLAKYGIESGQMEKATGVWLDIGTNKARKICAIGVRASKYVTMHGFALNVNTQLEYFNYINPCGFVDKGVTSMERELGYRINIDEVKEKLSKEFHSLFL